VTCPLCFLIDELHLQQTLSFTDGRDIRFVPTSPAIHEVECVPYPFTQYPKGMLRFLFPQDVRAGL